MNKTIFLLVIINLLFTAALLDDINDIKKENLLLHEQLEVSIKRTDWLNQRVATLEVNNGKIISSDCNSK